jgi:hypothetical protein
VTVLLSYGHPAASGVLCARARASTPGRRLGLFRCYLGHSLSHLPSFRRHGRPQFWPIAPPIFIAGMTLCGLRSRLGSRGKGRRL